MNTIQPRVTYYFSTGSRYSYLSMARVPMLERKHGVEFDWVPVNGKRLRALREADPFQGPPQSGQYEWPYREADARAWAGLYGIPYEEPQDVEFDVELLLRGVIAAGRQGRLRDFAWALAQEVFASGSWPLDQAVVDRVGAMLELDGTRLSRDCADPAVQVELEDNCAAAHARGAFGTPTLFLDEQLFFGNDRLVLLDHALTLRGRAEQAVTVTGLDHIVLTAHDPEALVTFYTDLLGCPVERTVGNFLWQLRIGDSLLDIIRAEADGRGTPNVDHVCLRVANFDLERITAYLESRGIDADPAPNIYGAQGFGPSVYFRDPLGNRVELKQGRG